MKPRLNPGTAFETGRLESCRGVEFRVAVKCVDLEEYRGEGGPRQRLLRVRKRNAADTGSPRRKRCLLLVVPLRRGFRANALSRPPGSTGTQG